MKHRNNLLVKSYYINRDGQLSLPFLFYYFQEIAWENARLLGFGYEYLQEENLFWVLARLKIKIDRFPGWKEEILLETWPRGAEGFFAFRDFSVKDKDSKIIISATTSWLILNTHTRRVQRLETITRDFPSHTESVLGENPGKVPPAQNAEPLLYTSVLYSDIDINQHFNSGKYIERIIDNFSHEFLSGHIVEEFEINFLKEGMPDDYLGVRIQELTAGYEYLCSVVRKEDNADLVRARIRWRKV